MNPKQLWWAAVPLGVGGIAAITLVALRANATLTVSTPFATLAIALGVALAVLWILGWVALRGISRVRQAAAADAEREARAARARFLRRLDHEVKNPVTAITTALATGGDDAHLIARKQSARLGALVGDLAKLADLETRVLEREPVDLETVARDAVDAVADRFPDRQYRVDFPRVPWPVPPVQGDADLLSVAVYNLVGNAAKYADPGARIEVRAAEHDGTVTLEVADTGWGIAAEDVASVWDDLARGSNARGVEGSGLGLPVVRLIARRHGGDATLRSQPGQGTLVTLRIPVR